jgi:hypothetical protein
LVMTFKKIILSIPEIQCPDQWLMSAVNMEWENRGLCCTWLILVLLVINITSAVCGWEIHFICDGKAKNSYLMHMKGSWFDFSLCLHMVFLLYLSVSLISSSYKDNSHAWLVPTHMNLFYPIYLFQDPIFKFSHILRHRQLGFKHMNFEEDTI